MSEEVRKREALEREMRGYVGRTTDPLVASDLVNEPMIRHFCEVTGDENPVYRDPDFAAKSVHGGIVAPPAMIDAWTMPPYIPAWDDEAAEAPNADAALHQLMARSGYSVVATTYDVEYARYVRLGERVTATKVIESISEEKSTPLGVGYFIDVRWTFRVDDEEVAWLLFRTLCYKPAHAPPAATAGSAAPAAPRRLRPPMGHDNSWWWEGLGRGELLIQKCSECGALRHPPRPMCPRCQSLAWGSQPSQGAGAIYSYTVMHHPPIPGYEYPFAVALIELDEGTRIVANVVGCDPSELSIGMRVQARIENVDDEMVLPMFHPAE